MAKKSAYTTMQLIAEILSFNTNQEALTKKLIQNSIDWDSVVIIGSQHLVLPALYCQLKDKGLLPLIPNDLNLYLEEITAINRGRNKILLKEVQEISEIFNKEKIEHVFIKGTALLAGYTFNECAERMIGDIDILVASNQLSTAFDILTINGYNNTISSILERKNRRHLPRQVSQNKFGAVELHKEVLIHRYRHLIYNEDVLKNKQIIDGIAIPSIQHSIKISILALQINDKAHKLGYVSFKIIYDCLALNLVTNKKLLNELSNQKHSQSFLHISSVFFEELSPKISSNYSAFLKRYFIFRIHYPKLGHFIYSTVYMTNSNLDRMRLLINNKSYRSHILKTKLLNKP